jgi:hypothetical protein
MTHRELEAQRQRSRRAEARERGDCQVCMKRPVLVGYSKCEHCHGYQRKKQGWKGGAWARGRADFVEIAPVAGATASFRLVVR